MRRWLPAVALALSVAGVAAAESEPVIEAADLVDPSLLAGPTWVVEPRVHVRGYQARFLIRTDWGEIEADSVELLGVRIAEMRALEAVHAAELDEVVAAATRERATEPVRAVGAVAREPVRALVGLPMGVARYFAEQWQRLRDATRRLGDRGREELMHVGSPYDDPDGLLGAAGDDQPGKSRGWWQRRGREATKLAKEEIGYRSARRKLAERLEVDPATRNPLLAPRLDALAWAETSGRFAVGQAIGLLGGPVTTALARSAQVDRWVLQPPPAQQRRDNLARIGRYCLDDRLARAFVRDGAYPPSLQTEFVEHLVALDPAEGCEALLETALMATDEPQARFVVHGLRLIRAEAGDAGRGGRFVPRGALLAYQLPDGERLVPLAVDWLAWTPDIERWFALGLDDEAAPHRLLVSGVVSDLAREEILARGWALSIPRGYPGAPPYRHGLQRVRFDGDELAVRRR